MPSTAFATMMAATLDSRKTEIFDQVKASHPLLAWMNAGGRIEVWEGGGENIEFNVKNDMSDRFAARDYKTPLSFKEQNPVEVLEIPRRFVNGSVIWYDAQVEANKGKFKIFDLVDILVEDAKTSASDVFALQLWQGGTGENLHGIPAIMTAATYATKARTTTTNNWWMARQGATYTITYPNGNTRVFGPYNTAEPLVISGGTDGGITKLYNDCCENGGTGGPDFAITSETLFRKLQDLVGAERIRYNEKMAELGYPENIQFRGATIVWDTNCGAVAGTPDATTFIFLNSKFLKLKPYSEYSKGFRATETFNLHSQGILAEGKMMQWAGNLICYKPSKQGMLTGKTA